MNPWFFLLILMCITLSTSSVFADSESYQQCLMDAISNADSNMRVGELRAECVEGLNQDGLVRDKVAAESSVVSRRMIAERGTEDNAFVISPYQPVYFLFAAYDFAGVNAEPWEQSGDREVSFDDVEAKFQISLKFPVVKNIFGNNGDLYAAYTNRSFWQIYNKDISSPFRETNHQPEAWLRLYSGWELFGFRNLMSDFGVVHQSNGKAGNLSRSWDRLYARFIFEKDQFAFALQPWYRIEEDVDSDDNPDIEDYMGHFEFTGLYKRNENQFSLMLRNNYSKHKGAVQLDWSFPIYGHLRGYVQWFSGYGESLIDYNHSVNSLGIGVKLADWL